MGLWLTWGQICFAVRGIQSDKGKVRRHLNQTAPEDPRNQTRFVWEDSDGEITPSRKDRIGSPRISNWQTVSVAGKTEGPVKILEVHEFSSATDFTSAWEHELLKKDWNSMIKRNTTGAKASSQIFIKDYSVILKKEISPKNISWLNPMQKFTSKAIKTWYKINTAEWHKLTDDNFIRAYRKHCDQMNIEGPVGTTFIVKYYAAIKRANERWIAMSMAIPGKIPISILYTPDPYTQRNRVFDLKGVISSKRTTTPRQLDELMRANPATNALEWSSEMLPFPEKAWTGKEGNFIFEVVHTTEEQQMKIIQTFRQDISFLSSQNLLDYSLLLRIDEMAYPTFESICSSDTEQRTNLKKIIKETKYINRLTAPGYDVVYFYSFGIIDILMDYKMLGPTKGTSLQLIQDPELVDPTSYGKRFVNWMENRVFQNKYKGTGETGEVKLTELFAFGVTEVESLMPCNSGYSPMEYSPYVRRGEAPGAIMRPVKNA